MIEHTFLATRLTQIELASKMPGWGIPGKAVSKTGMAQELNTVEQAIARALRDNLERIKHTSDELHHAVNDVVSACASNKPTNALPPLLRAQTAAASLNASLDVLARFVTVALQPSARSPFEAEIARLSAAVAAEAPPPAPEPVRPASAMPKPVVPMHAAPVQERRPPPPAQQVPVVEAHLEPEPVPPSVDEPAS